MRNRWFHLPLVWLSLLWFTVSNSVLAGALVVCRDVDGRWRVELGCERDGHGACSAREDHTGDRHEHGDDAAPCSDTPLGADAEFVKGAMRLAPDAALPPPVMLVVGCLEWAARVQPVGREREARRDRPPDALARVRTVVLLI